MKLIHRVENNICFCKIIGDLTSHNVQEIKDYLIPLLQDELLKAMIIDFEKVNFIDSHGIGILMHAFKTLEQRNAKLALHHLSKKNAGIFKVAQIDNIIEIYSSKEEAIQCLGLS